jgi:hypothetical protein
VIRWKPAADTDDGKGFSCISISLAFQHVNILKNQQDPSVFRLRFLLQIELFSVQHVIMFVATPAPVPQPLRVSSHESGGSGALSNPPVGADACEFDGGDGLEAGEFTAWLALPPNAP